MSIEHTKSLIIIVILIQRPEEKQKKGALVEKAQQQRQGAAYVRSDGEVELFLNVTLERNADITQENAI